MKKMIAFLLLVSLGVLATAQQKYALVIGNGTYTNFGTLKNPVNDANDVTAALQGLGFTVEKVLDGNLSQMESAALRLKERLVSAGRDSYGFFYYAGHGVQAEGLNYLIPANANIPGGEFLRERAVSAQTVLDILNGAKNALNIVVLDACRDFPADWSRSAARGLAVMHPPTDSIIMYATAAGRTAADGSERNGLFTSHLLKHLQTPGLEVNEVFRRTMSDVARASGDAQRPAMYTDFAETAYLGTKPAPAAAAEPVPAPPAAPVSAVASAPANRPATQSAPSPAAQAVPVPRPVSITYTTKLPAMKHPNNVLSVAWSPDGRYIASGSNDGTIKLWDAAAGREVRSFAGHSSAARSVAFSPDGRYIASGSKDKTIKLMDAAAGREIRTLSGHSGEVSSVAFSPDGKNIASGSYDGTIKIWDAATGRQIRTLSGHSDEVNSVAFSPDGRYIASGSKDKTIKIWNAAAGRELRSFSGHTSSVYSVVWSPGSKYVVSGSGDTTARIWDATTGRELRVFEEHSNNVLTVAWSPDGKYIASGSGDSTVRIWDIVTGKEIQNPERSSYIYSAVWSPDGRYIVSGSRDSTVRVWDAATGEQK